MSTHDATVTRASDDVDSPLTLIGEPEIPEPPPLPDGVSPDMRYFGDLQKWQTKVLTAETRRHEANDQARHDHEMRLLRRIVKKVGDIDADLDKREPPTGPLARVLAYLDTMPTVKQALANGAVLIIGAATMAGAAYFTFQSQRWTPTPPAEAVVVGQPGAGPLPAASAATPAEETPK